MPPTSSVRKSSLATNPTANTASYTTDANALSTGPRRTTSGRTIRTNTTRPANYYARPFGTAMNNLDGSNDANDASPPGFFPALQYFSDAITALPKEVMRQFTLMKEVEAKIHGPNETLGELVDALMELPVPTRQGALGQQGQHALLMSLTANNSTMGSASASLVNGVAGRQLSAQHSTAGSVNGEEGGAQQQADGDAELARRKQYHELRMLAHSLLPNLDEKNVVLAEANRVLSLQLARVDSVMPHVESEISEESRLGSMTHWAYSDNRQKKVAPAPPANRRDVAATNSLAAAANAIHETEIAQARRDAGREATREKHKGRTAKEHVDSDFDDKPRKTQGKLGKGKAALQAAAVTGLGISTGGEPVKRRKVDKGLAAPGMERTTSGTGKGAKGQRETPRSTPAMEPAVSKVKKTKAAPVPGKKRMPTSSAQASPALASSPLMSSFNSPAMMDPPVSARMQSTRLRQNSSATNLRHERLVDDEEGSGSLPTSTTVKKVNGNGEKKTNGKRKAPVDDEVEVPEERPAESGKKAAAAAAAVVDKADKADKEVETTLKHEDIDMPDATANTSRSGSNSGKASGRASKTGTPRTENFPTDVPSMARTRSTRSMRAVSMRESSSAEPMVQGARVSKVAHIAASGGHKRNASNSHLVKQLAPFNRSPDLDRHFGDEDEDGEGDGDGDEDVEMEAGEERPRGRRKEVVEGADEEGSEARREPALRRPSLRKPASRPVSRRNTQPVAAEPSSPASPSVAPQVRSEEKEGETAQEAEGAQSEARQAANPPTPTMPEEEHEEEEEQPVPAIPANSLQTPAAAAAAAASPSTPTPEPEEEPEEEVPELDPEPISSPASSPIAEVEVEVEDEEEEEEEEDDPDDPKYCYCNRGSYGEMVACDNSKCAIEWFHLGCTELREAPGEEETWFCRNCRPSTTGGNGGGRKRGGGGGGGGVGRGGRR